MITLQTVLLFSAMLFCLGLAATLLRRNAILMLIGIELMLTAANINFIAFWRFGPALEQAAGVLFALFSIAVAAGEAAVGLALILLIYRHYRSIDPQEINRTHD
jgi:NADH:ubiquinone oxidoreductase subunit K